MVFVTAVPAWVGWWDSSWALSLALAWEQWWARGTSHRTCMCRNKSGRMRTNRGQQQVTVRGPASGGGTRKEASSRLFARRSELPVK